MGALRGVFEVRAGCRSERHCILPVEHLVPMSLPTIRVVKAMKEYRGMPSHSGENHALVDPPG